jgi:hypothetical protein
MFGKKPQQPQQLPPVVSGPINRVPCPHCGKPNDFRELQQQQLLDTGHSCDCDHCGGLMVVAAIQPITMITVRKSNQRPKKGIPAPQQARTLSAAQAQRLLKGR